MELLIFFTWVVFSIVVGIVAHARGRSGMGFALLALLLSPLLGIIVVALLPVRSTAAERTCPSCAERVLAAASKCKHCGAELVPQAASHRMPCPHCGKTVWSDSYACRHCNARLLPQ